VSKASPAGTPVTPLEPQRISLATSVIVFIALLQFSFAAGHTAVTVTLAAIGLVAILLRGLIPIPTPALLPLMLIVSLIVFGNTLTPGEHATFLVGGAYPAGIMIGIMVLIFELRMNPPVLNLWLLFAALFLTMLAATTMEVFPFAYGLIVQAAFLASGLRRFMPRAVASTSQPFFLGDDRTSVRAMLPVIAVLLLAGAIAFCLRTSEGAFNEMLRMAEPTMPQGAAFLTSSKLDAILNEGNSDRILARVTSPAPGVYYVAGVFTKFDKDSWYMQDANAWKRLSADEPVPGFKLPSGYGAFTLKPEARSSPLVIDAVDLDDSLAAAIPAPRDTQQVGASVADVMSYPRGVLGNQGGKPMGTYYLARDPKRATWQPANELAAAMREQCLQVPPEVANYVEPLATEVTAASPNDERRAADVAQYMQTHYKYAHGFKFRSKDHLHEFLIDKTPAHCEFFATSMVMMLRTLKIPARYVTGFIVTEKNDLGDYWVVRDQHAHAWVEAWFPGQGWVTFDPTAPDDRPQSSHAMSHLQKWMDWLGFRIHQWRQQFADLNPKRLLTLALNGVQSLGRWLIAKPLRVVVLLLLFAVEYFFRRQDAPGRRWWRRRRRGRIETGAADEHQLVARLQGVLERLDRALGRRGVERPEHLTLLEFARELSVEAPARLSPRELELAEQILRGYCVERYAHTLPDAERLAALEQLGDALEDEVARRRQRVGVR
jgi:hypothetical protein